MDDGDLGQVLFHTHCQRYCRVAARPRELQRFFGHADAFSCKDQLNTNHGLLMPGSHDMSTHIMSMGGPDDFHS